MFIKDTQIDQSYDENGNLIVSVNNTQISIDPDVMSQAWVLYESQRYDLIKSLDSWKKDVYNYILANNDNPNIVLIALLLSQK